MLPAVGAHVHRCRDCRHRFWVGTIWSRIVFGALAVTFIAGVITTMVLVRRSRNQPPPPPRVRLRKRRQVPPMPRGLPPLSSVPAPKDKTEQREEPATGEKDSK